MSCSLAVLFQITMMRMPHVELAGVVFCFAGIGVACSALLSLGYFQGYCKHSCIQCKFCKKRCCCFLSSLGAAEGSGCLSVIQGRCGCMLHYFEHVLIVISSYIGWQITNPVSFVCGERDCPGAKYSVSWVGCPELLKLRGKVKRWGHSFFSDHGMVAKGCQLLIGGQSPRMWAFSQIDSALILLPVIESRGSRLSSPWNSVARSWTGGISRVYVPWWWV
jgi:hypothetical protein